MRIYKVYAKIYLRIISGGYLMDNKNKISRPDFEKAEAEVLETHREGLEKKLANAAWRSLRSGNQPEIDNNETGPRDHDDLGDLSDFLDDLDEFTAEEKPHAIEEISERSKKAQEVMRGLIRQNIEESGREYFRLKNAEQDEKLRLRLIVERSRNISSRTRVTDRIRDNIDAIEEQKKSLVEQSPESHLVVHGYEFRDHIAEIKNGEIATTPYVQENLGRIQRNMAEGSPTFIHGHLGSGKTELAITAAKRTVIDKVAFREAKKEFKQFKEEHPEASPKESREAFGKIYRKNITLFEKAAKDGDERFMPLIVSGSKDLTGEDLYVDKTLKLKSNDKEIAKLKGELDAEIDKWRSEHPEEAKDPEKSRAEIDKIIELYKLKNQAFGTEIETVEKAIYRGIKEGRPVIIDEVNAIPAAILISLNNIMERRPGDKCYVPGVKEPVEIKDGFSLTMTGNLSSGNIDYSGTEELNAAWLSRCDSINYDYLPVSEKNPEKNELFHVMLAYLCERTGDLELPEMDKSIKKLLALSQLAHATQSIFSGGWRESSVLGTESGDEVEPRLEKSVLSVRNILNVLKEWNKGDEKDLDKALWDSFISSMVNPDEQNLALQLAKAYGFFSESDGWVIEAKGPGAGFASLSKIHPNEFTFERKPMEVYDLRQVIGLLYGPSMEREVYPNDIDLDELEDLVDEEFTLEDSLESEAKIKELSDAIKALEVLSAQCGCDIEAMNKSE